MVTYILQNDIVSELLLQILVEWCRGSDKSGAEVLE